MNDDKIPSFPKVLDAGEVELPGVSKGIFFNIDLLKRVPDKYGKSLEQKLKYMTALVSDLRDNGIKVEFTEMKDQ